MFADVTIATQQNVLLPISTGNIIDYVTSRQRLDHIPGTTYAYSNYGFMLLGRIIEATSGLPYEQYLQRRVFFPLGVRNVSMGRSLYEYRQPNEVKYQAPEFEPTVMDPSGGLVPIAYGAFNLENADSAGGWIASAADLVRYAASLDNPERSPVLGPEAVDSLFGLPENISPAGYRPGDYYYAMGWAVRDYGFQRDHHAAD